MPIRCKLISPTNLLLEHPMFNRGEEVEFLVVGVKEFETSQRSQFFQGMMIGAFIAGAILSLAVVLGVAFQRDHSFNHTQYPIPGVSRPSGSQTRPVSYGKRWTAPKVAVIA